MKTQVSLSARIGTPTAVGLAILLVFVGGFGAWAALAPLAGAAIAPGIVSPEGSRRIVQHLEGGIVREILVAEGDRVAAGQPLIEMEQTQARATYERTLSQWWRVRAVRERIIASQAREEQVGFAADVLKQADEDAEYRDFIAIQRQLHGATVEAHVGKVNVLHQQIGQLNDAIAGHRVEIEGATEQISLIDEELEGLTKLDKRGLAMKPRILELSRERARLVTDIGRTKSEVAAARQKIAETELQILNEQTDFSRQRATELTETNSQLAQLTEQNTSARDVLKRTVVRAPVDGTIVSLKTKTRGGVVRPGDILMEVVPLNETLVIDARLTPNDIDIIHVGQFAQVHLLPYRQRDAAPLEGKVQRIASDTTIDELTGQYYYPVQIHVERNDILTGEAVELTPGMPAEVYIITGNRTMLGYLSEPVLRSFRRSFRED